MVEKEGFSKKKTFLFLFIILSLAVLSSIFFNQLTGNWMKYGTGPYYYNCSNCSDCSSAIADASSGDIISLNATIYSTPQSCINLTNKTNIVFDCLNNYINGSGYGIWLVNTNNSQIKNCNISGFVSGVYLFNSINNTLTNLITSRNIGSGISLYSANNTLLMGITANDNNYGIYSVYSYNGIITNTTTNNNSYYGITLVLSNNNNLSDLNVTNNRYSGINLSVSTFNTITNVYVNNDSTGIMADINTIYTIKNSHIENNLYGLFYSTTPNNTLVYNNSFNNSYNIYTYNPSMSCFFNTSKTLATNIIGKSYTGGNFWATPTGTGFSQNCTNDSDADYICDYPYNISFNYYDYLPLIYNITNVTTCTENWTACTSWSSCVGGNQTRTCTDSNSCGTNVSRPSLNQTCTVVSNVTTNTTAPPSSGGGGGGGTGANSTTGIGTNVTQNVTTPITPTNPAVITINDSQIYLTKITLNVLESIQSASVTVTKVNVLENATLKMGLPSGQLYQGFKIETSGVTSSNVANVTIEFKVNKLWLTSKNGTINGIQLYRRPDTSSQWNGLVTTLTSQDSEYYYFTSVSPGFSTFAVFFTTCQGIDCETSLATKSIIIYIIIAVVGIAILVTAYILIRKLKKKQ